MQTQLGIILLNWNNQEDTITCLNSLALLSSPDFAVTIYVVDNGSDNTQWAKVSKKFPHVVILQLEQNLGFTGGNNVGIRKALEDGCEYVWILNNDTIVDAHAAKELIHAMRNTSIGIAGSKIFFMKGHEFHKQRYSPKELGNVIWYAGGLIDWDNMYGSHRGVDEVDHGQYDTSEETAFVTGCSLMISKACLMTIGLFNDKYFAFLEDMDLSLRAQIAGFKTMYIPASKVWHKNASSTGGAGNVTHQYYMTRNRLLFGLSYGAARTKFALLREAFRIASQGTPIQKHAIIDAALGKWGKKPN